jgi:FixJ family two-component response regulator
MSTSSDVYLIDDDPSYLRAMARVLSAAGFRVRSYPEATLFLTSVSPDTRGCIVADLAMPYINGLQLQAKLADAGSTMPVIFLTGHADIPSTVRAMRSGALDFLEKTAPDEEVIAAIVRALERDAAGCAARMRLVELGRRFALLTCREREVLSHVVRGRMNKQIAATLGINERTVKLHRTAITRKLGVHSVARLTTLVRDVHLFDDEPSTSASP